MKKSSKNFILYRGRYIRRFTHRSYPAVYVVSWNEDSRERQMFYGSLQELLEKIDDTVSFFGKWAYLI